MHNPEISIIIPAKDEEKRLPIFLESIAQFCISHPDDYEIIVVDDGSSDHTSEVAQSFKEKIKNLIVLRLALNQGKGNAVKHGFNHAKGKIVLFIDADGATPINEIARHKHWLDQGYDIVIGSREVIDQAATVNTKPHRKFMGRIFNNLVQSLLIKDIKDTQCGFKMFNRNTINPIFQRIELNGFGFDLEILYVAQKLKFRIKECAVNWRHVPGSKVHLIKDSWRMLLNIFEIRRRHTF